MSSSAQSVENHLNEGDLRYASFDTEGAIKHYIKAFESGEENADVLIRLARAWNDAANDLKSEGHDEEARRAVKNALKFAELLTVNFPSRAESWFYRAAATGNLAVFSKGRTKVKIGRKVEEYSLRAIKLDSAYALPHIALGMYYREVANLNRLQRIVANRLLGGLPSRPSERALKHLERAVSLNPSLPVAHYQLAKTREALGLRHKANPHFIAAYSLPPMNSRDRRNAATARKIVREYAGQRVSTISS